MSRRRNLSAAAAAAVAQMVFGFAASQGIAAPEPTFDARARAEAHAQISRSDLRGAKRALARTIVRSADEHGIAVLSHGEIAHEVGCVTRTSKRCVPVIEDEQWAIVIRPPVYASNRLPGQPGQLVFMWRPGPQHDGLRDAGGPKRRAPRPPRAASYRDQIGSFVDDPAGTSASPPPSPSTSLPSTDAPTTSPSAEDRALVLSTLAELDRLLPHATWASDAYVAKLFAIAKASGKRAAHVGGAAQGLARVVRARLRDGKPTSAGWALAQLEGDHYIPRQLANKVAKRPVASTPAAAPKPAAPPVELPPLTPSRLAIARGTEGIPLAAPARAFLASLAAPTPALGEPQTAPLARFVKLNPDSEKPPD